MPKADQTRDRAMHALLAAVFNMHDHPKESSNIQLVRDAVDAIAQHAIAVAEAHYLEHAAIDAVDHPDG